MFSGILPQLSAIAARLSLKEALLISGQIKHRNRRCGPAYFMQPCLKTFSRSFRIRIQEFRLPCLFGSLFLLLLRNSKKGNNVVTQNESKRHNTFLIYFKYNHKINYSNPFESSWCLEDQCSVIYFLKEDSYKLEPNYSYLSSSVLFHFLKSYLLFNHSKLE